MHTNASAKVTYITMSDHNRFIIKNIINAITPHPLNNFSIEIQHAFAHDTADHAKFTEMAIGLFSEDFIVDEIIPYSNISCCTITISTTFKVRRKLAVAQ